MKKAFAYATGVATGSIIYDLLRHGADEIDFGRAAVQGTLVFAIFALFFRK